MAGEGLISYTWRLAAANDMRETAVIRALGRIFPTGSGYHLRAWDAALNESALERLEVLCGIPRARLEKAIPALTRRKAYDLPADHPVVRTYASESHRLIAPCPQCALRHGAAVGALVYPGAAGECCPRHGRWLTGQPLDLAPLPQLVSAAWRYRRLITRGDGSERVFTRYVIRSAERVTLGWTERGLLHITLAEVWKQRAEVLGTDPRHFAVRLPEMLRLANVIGDLPWRRHVAMVGEWEMDPFYRRLEQALPALRPLGRHTTTWYWRYDPIQDWIKGHRASFAPIRDCFYNSRSGTPWHTRAEARPFPPLERFKLPPPRR